RARNGSRYAVLGSAIRTMSDSWISWNPRTDEPSNAWPSSNCDSSTACAGTDTCCITPGRSQKRRSTNSTPSSAISSSTSFGVRRDGPVLHHTGQIAEAQVDELDALFGDQLQHLVRRALFHGPSMGRTGEATLAAAPGPARLTPDRRCWCRPRSGVASAPMAVGSMRRGPRVLRRPAQYVVAGFAAATLVGAGLLMLPAASTSGRTTGFVDAW